MKIFLNWLKLAIVFIVVINSSHAKAQDKYMPWVYGIGMNAVDYFPVNNVPNGNDAGLFNQISNAKDHWNVFAPRLSATRYLMEKIALDLSLSFNSIKKVGVHTISASSYVALDANLNYFPFGNQRRIAPFLLVGGGYTMAMHSGGTLNTGVGTSVWLSDTIGLNIQGMHKYNAPNFSLYSHFFYGLSVLFKSANYNSGRKKRSCF